MNPNRACPTTGCTVVPPLGFCYCEEHAGSERNAYAMLHAIRHAEERAAQAEREADINAYLLRKLLRAGS